MCFKSLLNKGLTPATQTQLANKSLNSLENPVNYVANRKKQKNQEGISRNDNIIQSAGIIKIIYTLPINPHFKF